MGHVFNLAVADLDRVAAGAFVSFAQNFEDLQVRKILGRDPTSYLDVGASHPVWNSVTMASYLAGNRGLTVDMRAETGALHKKYRGRDQHISGCVVPPGFAGTSMY